MRRARGGERKRRGGKGKGMRGAGGREWKRGKGRGEGRERSLPAAALSYSFHFVTHRRVNRATMSPAYSPTRPPSEASPGIEIVFKQTRRPRQTRRAGAFLAGRGINSHGLSLAEAPALAPGRSPPAARPLRPRSSRRPSVVCVRIQLPFHQAVSLKPASLSVHLSIYRSRCLSVYPHVCVYVYM